LNGTRQTLDALANLRLSRRDALKFFAVPALSAMMPTAVGANIETRLRFSGVRVSATDDVSIAKGYRQQLFYAWGDPVSDGPAFRPDASKK
jgi:uncharacterized protein